MAVPDLFAPERLLLSHRDWGDFSRQVSHLTRAPARVLVSKLEGSTLTIPLSQ